MYPSVIDDIGLIIAVLHKDTLEPILLSDAFKILVGPTFTDIIEFLQSQEQKLTKQHLLDMNNSLSVKFVAEIKMKRARQAIEFKMSKDSQGNILIYGNDVTGAKKLEYLLKSHKTLLEKQQKLYKMAYTDSLTKVPNRRAFYEHFAADGGDRDLGVSAVCILDIDHFKRVNDRYGHKFGDYVLSYFAVEVESELDELCYFARLGGEEFGVYSKDRTGPQLRDLITGVLEKIKNKTLKTPNGDGLNLSFSAGVAEQSKDGHSLKDLLNKADKALYVAKNNGRGSVLCYSDELFYKVIA